MILDTVNSATPQATTQDTPQVNQLLKVLKGEMSRDALQQALALKDRKSFRERYLQPALKLDLIEMTIPDKPNSPPQHYRLTHCGKQLKARMKKNKRV